MVPNIGPQFPSPLPLEGPSTYSTYMALKSLVYRSSQATLALMLVLQTIRLFFHHYHFINESAIRSPTASPDILPILL
jgi:hypothetical protein